MNFQPYMSDFEKKAFSRSYKCNKCKRSFSTLVQTNAITGRIPLILPCSHPVCEECVLHMVKKQDVQCEICKYSFQMDDDKNMLRHVFPVDRYMFGALLQHTMSSSTFQAKYGARAGVLDNMVPAGASLMSRKNIIKITEASSSNQVRQTPNKQTVKGQQLCSQQGCLKSADIKCINCVELYCVKCDKTIHESIKILRNHTRYPVHIAAWEDFNVCCEKHSSKMADYMCNSCDTKMFCFKCIIQDHQGHVFISVEDVNRNEFPQFGAVMEKARYILKCLEQARNKVKQELTVCRPKYSPSQTEHDIIKHFAYLHSRLQHLEDEMLNDLRLAQSNKAETLNKILHELEENIKILSPLVSTGYTVIHKPEHLEKLFLRKLQCVIEDNLRLPCNLMEGEKNTPTTEFIVDNTFLDVLAAHCRVNIEKNTPFKLAPVIDFTDCHVLTSEESEASIDTNSSVTSVLSSSNNSDTGVQERVGNSGATTKEPKVPTMYYSATMKKTEVKSSEDAVLFVPGTKESIKVTHLVSPSFFYVQLVRKQNEIFKLTDKYNLSAQYAATPSNLELGKTYLVEYIRKDFKSWYRAIIKNQLSDELFEVFYIDYGNTDQVPLHRIREIKPHFMQNAPYAYRCRLGGLVPIKNDWNDEVIQFMVRFFTGNNPSHVDMDEISAMLKNGPRNPFLEMIVDRNHKGVMEVDLFSHGQSLSYAMLFVGLAANVTSKTPQSSTQNCIKTLKQKKIMPTVDNFAQEQIHNVRVTNIENPHHLYIQLVENQTSIIKMEHNMASVYKKDKNSANKLIFTPETGMSCAAKLSFDNRWHRVEIVDLPGIALVEVFAVDYGVCEVITWDQLRRLNECFMKIDAQAVKVSLADIVPRSEGNWTCEATNYLINYTNNKALKIYVNKCDKDQLHVTLYDTAPELDVCINALLVRKEFAESSGDSSLLVEFHKLPESIERIQQNNYLETLICAIQTYDKENSEEQEGMDVLKDGHHHEAIDVLHIDSPSSFYVTAQKWTDEKRRFQKKLKKFYSELMASDKPWTVGAVCVVNSTKDRAFYRAVVKKVLDNDQFEVFLKDIVRSEVIPVANMFEMDNSFNHPDFSLKCCLAGVQPAGGTTKWPNMTVEYFTEIVGKYSRLYMTKMGRIIDKVLPINLIAFIEENNGPLEPSTIKTVVLNKCLLDKGLALPLKVEMEDDNVSVKSDTENELEVDKASGEPAKIRLRTSSGSNSNSPAICHVEDIAPSNSQVTSWRPPYRIIEKKFKAWPSYVDHTGHVYIHTERDREIIRNIRRCMNVFLKTRPDPQRIWEPGQICSVQYHLDQSFCRGTVASVTAHGTINVKLVDFGNEEECTHDELRSEVMLTDRPIVATECILAGVVPKSKHERWPVPVLDTLHHMIVDKECQVTVVEEENSAQLLAIQLYLCGACVNSEVMKWNWTQGEGTNVTEPLMSDSNDDVVIEGEIDEDEKCEEIEISTDIDDIGELLEDVNSYTRMEIPQNSNSLKGVVISVLNSQTVIMEPAFLGEYFRQTKDQFNSLVAEIDVLAEHQPALQIFAEGTPCVALYAADKQWYRAEVYTRPEENAEQINVLYVDYGNVDYVPRQNLRQTKTGWTDLPVQLIKCKIWGIVKHENVDESTASSELVQALVDKELICQIVCSGSELEVKLINPDTYDLAYKEAIDRGIFVSTD